MAQKPEELGLGRQGHCHSGIDAIGQKDANIEVAAFRLHLKRKFKTISKPTFMFKYVDLMVDSPSDRK